MNEERIADYLDWIDREMDLFDMPGLLAEGVNQFLLLNS